LLDGTEDSNWGKILGEAIMKLASIRGETPYINVTPGSLDWKGYDIVKGLEDKCINRARNQVFLEELCLMTARKYADNGYPHKIILTGEDIFSKAAKSWCFGGNRFCDVGTGQERTLEVYTVISTHRVQDYYLFWSLCAHELGHAYGAAREGRKNTEMKLGSHCTNDLCVMQQKTDIREARDYAMEIYNSGKDPPYCPECINDLLANSEE